MQSNKCITLHGHLKYTNYTKDNIENLHKHAQMENHKFMLWGLTNEMVNCLKEVQPNYFKYEEISNWSDYIYEKDKVIHSKVMRKARVFEKHYKERYKIEEISENNIKEVIKFQNEWMDYNAKSNDDVVSLNFENESIIETLNQWKYLPLKGYCVRVNGIIVGFCYGILQTSNCFTLHVIKSDKTINGLTMFLFRYIVETIGTKYINFEEDIGIEGLRIFKTRLQPCYMLDKYRVFSNISHGCFIKEIKFLTIY